MVTELQLEIMETLPQGQSRCFQALIKAGVNVTGCCLGLVETENGRQYEFVRVVQVGGFCRDFLMSALPKMNTEPHPWTGQPDLVGQIVKEHLAA